MHSILNIHQIKYRHAVLGNKHGTYHCLLAVHPEIEFILVPICSFLSQPLNAILLGVVVPRSEDIVLVFLEEAELGAVGELRALFVIASMQ